MFYGCVVGLQSTVTCVSYSNQRRGVLGAASLSGAVCYLDVNTGKASHFSLEHAAPCRSIAFSPVNELLLVSAGYDKKLVCYNVNTLKWVWVLFYTISSDFFLRSFFNKHYCIYTCLQKNIYIYILWWTKQIMWLKLCSSLSELHLLVLLCFKVCTGCEHWRTTVTCVLPARRT